MFVLDFFTKLVFLKILIVSMSMLYSIIWQRLVLKDLLVRYSERIFSVLKMIFFL